MMLPLVSLCLIAWVASVLFYGLQWDRRNLKEVTA